MGFFSKIFRREISEEKLDDFFRKKDQAMESVLGEKYHLVGHSIIPFHVGGAVDMYIYPHLIEGTAFATMELIEYFNNGPIPNRNGMYELLAFTKIKIEEDLNKADNENNRFKKMERRLCGIFTSIGNYSRQAKLEPGETCEIPGNAGEDNICLIFEEFVGDDKKLIIDSKKYSFLICIEIFRSEMEYAMNNGSMELFKLLNQKGFYPFCDLDREPVA